MAVMEEEAQQLQSPQLVLDDLFCEEESFQVDLSDSNVESVSQNGAENLESDGFSAFFLFDHDLLWGDDELLCLMSKERETHFWDENLISDEALLLLRKEAVEWIYKVKAHYWFSASTTVLAVNYFDRFTSSLNFQNDKPWLGQLIAVSCLSLAAKVEETQVPLLLDLQVDDSRYVFEAKTIQKMELLVLSTLQWRMNPVTPISFFDHIIRRLGPRNHHHLHQEFLWRCEHLLLSAIADSRSLSYLPSVLAAATMQLVIQDVEPFDHLKYQKQLMEILKISEDRVNECFNFIQELSGSLCKNNTGEKRKHLSTPNSPKGVIDLSFCCDSSSDSWAASVSLPSPPEPQFKRSRTYAEQMQLPLRNCMFVDVLGSPH